MGDDPLFTLKCASNLESLYRNSGFSAIARREYQARIFTGSWEKGWEKGQDPYLSDAVVARATALSNGFDDYLAFTSNSFDGAR